MHEVFKDQSRRLLSIPCKAAPEENETGFYSPDSETHELVLLSGQSVKTLLVSDSTSGLTAHQLLSLKRDMAASLLYCVVCFPAL